jgi:hypothetical protein
VSALYGLMPGAIVGTGAETRNKEVADFGNFFHTACRNSTWLAHTQHLC